MVEHGQLFHPASDFHKDVFLLRISLTEIFMPLLRRLQLLLDDFSLVL